MNGNNWTWMGNVVWFVDGGIWGMCVFVDGGIWGMEDRRVESKWRKPQTKTNMDTYLTSYISTSMIKYVSIEKFLQLI